MSKNYWSGKYSDSKEANDSLEDDVRRLAEEGRIRSELPEGGTMDERYGPDGLKQIDVYSPSNSSPNGHSHDKVDSNGNHFHRD